MTMPAHAEPLDAADHYLTDRTREPAPDPWHHYENADGTSWLTIVATAPGLAEQSRGLALVHTFACSSLEAAELHVTIWKLSKDLETARQTIADLRARVPGA
jgi:hypothetical protein